MQKRGQTSWFTGSRRTFAWKPLHGRRRHVGLAGEDAYGMSARVLLPQRLSEGHFFALFCLCAAVPKVAVRLVVCALVWICSGSRGDGVRGANGRGVCGAEYEKYGFACQTWAQRDHGVCVLFRAERLFQTNSRRPQGHAQHAAHSRGATRSAWTGGRRAYAGNVWFNSQSETRDRWETSGPCQLQYMCDYSNSLFYNRHSV